MRRLQLRFVIDSTAVRLLTEITKVTCGPNTSTVVDPLTALGFSAAAHTHTQAYGRNVAVVLQSNASRTVVIVVKRFVTITIWLRFDRASLRPSTLLL